MKIQICDEAAWPLWFQPIAIMQDYLRFISGFYPDIPRIFVNGYFDEDMTAAVMAFQQEFDLPMHGRIDFATWEMIVAVRQGLEQVSDGSEINNWSGLAE